MNLSKETIIEHHLYSNCIQDIFITYLKWQKRDYYKLFDNNWSFKFELYNSYYELDIYRDSKFSALIESLYLNFGIDVIFFEKNLEMIREKIKSGKILGACIDTYYCEWHKSYQLNHNNHYILIVKVENDGLICIDPYTTNKPVKIMTYNFEKIIKKIFFITNNKFSHNAWQNNLLKNIKRIFGNKNNTSDFNQMRKFGDSIVERKDIYRKEVKQYTNLAFYPLILKLNNIGYGRKCFQIMLNKLNDRDELLLDKEFIDEVGVMAKEWSKVSALFIKFIMLDFSDEIAYKIRKRIYLISEKEELLAKDLLLKIGGAYENN